jgi:IS5 family transposase
VALIQESLSVAHNTGALATRDLERVVVDTTVQPKAIAYPTDARLCHRALEKLVDLARCHDVPLRQSYRRVAKRAAIMVGRYTHAHQFKRARRELKFLRIRLGRVIRDIRRKIAGKEALEEHFADLLALAVRVRFQDHRQRGRKVYALHAPEVECIGKGKARAPYEFGCKVSVATPATKPKGGQFVLHAKALHGNPFDGHTLGPVIAELEALTGIETRRIHVDKGYRGHNHTQKFRVWISGQVRRVTAAVRREMRRRAAVEPVIGQGWTLRNRCAEPADLNRCIFRSRRRTTWCEFSAGINVTMPLIHRLAITLMTGCGSGRPWMLPGPVDGTVFSWRPGGSRHSRWSKKRNRPLHRQEAAMWQCPVPRGTISRRELIQSVGSIAGAIAMPGIVAARAASTDANATVKVVPEVDLKVLDPIWTTALITATHAWLIYDTLFAPDREYQVHPQMVEKYERDEDGLTWRFKLRDGLGWHDGTAVTARDCVASLRARRPGTKPSR